MKLKDLGPFAVFRFEGRVYVKSSGMIQMLDRSGSYFEANKTGMNVYWPEDTEVEKVDLTSPREVQSCEVCFGGGYEPGKWHDSAHGYGRVRCPKGCLVEGRPDPVAEKPKEPTTCECCQQPLLDCERGAPPGIKEKTGSMAG